VNDSNRLEECESIQSLSYVRTVAIPPEIVNKIIDADLANIKFEAFQEFYRQTSSHICSQNVQKSRNVFTPKRRERLKLSPHLQDAQPQRELSSLTTFFEMDDMVSKSRLIFNWTSVEGKAEQRAILGGLCRDVMLYHLECTLQTVSCTQKYVSNIS